jgi:long-chain fatty acid transport protein
LDSGTIDAYGWVNAANPSPWGTNMHKLLRLLAAALVATAAAPALATNGMRMIGFSPVQNGMGGVGVGATLDGGTVLTNPAGMSELGRRLDLSLTWFQPFVEYDATGAPLPQGAFVMSPGTTIKSDRGGSPIPNIGLILPLGGGFTVGVGAFGVGGMGVDHKANLYGGRTLTAYQQLRLAPAVAYKVNDLFAAGIALNAMWGQMKYDVASGFGATIGLKLTPMKDLTFGLAYETKSTFSDYSFDIPAHQAPDGAGGVVSIPAGTDKLTFHQPAVATVGAAYRPLPALLVGADLQWINWSDVMGKNQPRYKNMATGGSTTGALPFDMSWSDQLVVKVGAEIAAAQAVKVRVGVDYGKNPLDKDRAFENIAFPAVAETHLTAGLGWDATETLAVNLGAMYAPKVTVEGANAAYPPDGQGLTSYRTAMSQYSLDLGLGWRF